MNLQNILRELDKLYDEHRIEKIAPFLEENIVLAQEAGKEDIVLSLLNELIGFFRDTSQFEEALICGEKILNLIEIMEIQNTYPYATSKLNVANAYRAAGKLEDSKDLYDEVIKTYGKLMEIDDYRFAPLFNNVSLLCQEMNDFEAAVEYLSRAIDIVKKLPDKKIELAISHTNIATSLLRLNRLPEAMRHLKEAFAIFEENPEAEKDFHYMAALSAMAEALYLSGDLEGAVAYYNAALQEIEKNVGKTAAYEITLQNLKQVEAQLHHLPKVQMSNISGLALAESFYNEFGAPMLATKFPEYVPYIAVGLVGEGSECLGFDDETSHDHDFGPGFCMWITDEVYEKIGEELQREYDKLPRTYMGITRKTTKNAGKRVGVFTISEFYDKYIGCKDVPTSEVQWLYLEDYQLKNVTNGKVFRDDLGEFSRIRREILKHYPESVRIKKIARMAALIAQSGQYNYSRMLERGDTVAAQIALAEFSKSVCEMVYLLNRVYAPFYKWMRRGLKDLPRLSQIGDLLDAISRMPIIEESITDVIETIVSLIIAEMKKQSLTHGDDNYLDAHTGIILQSLPMKEENNTNNMESNLDKENLIKEIVQLEWEAFDKTNNEGGRADCQDDFGTFNVMRRSQYMQWDEGMILSFISDFKEANKVGRNLIAEKYGRMMESTAPDRYAQIKDAFPILDEDRIKLQEAIIAIQVGMMEECALRFPKAATNARSIHTSEDNLFNTSYETYLRGEIGTYSDETLQLYGRFIARLASEGRNLAMEIIENTAKMYGYESLEDLEGKLD